jgi:glycerol-3-phosphate acyltransferase PlsY
MNVIVSAVVAIVLSYLAGAIPTSLAVGKLFFKTDIRRHGSGNAGATNVFRVFGWKAGVAVIVVDIGKGVAAVLLIAQLGTEAMGPYTSQLSAAVAAVIGHIWTVFAGFRGGKGVGTAAGALAALHPLALFGAVLVFAVLLTTTGYVSVGSLSGAIAFPVLVWLFDISRTVPTPPGFLYFSIAVALVVFFSHRTNIRRLLAGTENRFDRIRIFRPR